MATGELNLSSSKPVPAPAPTPVTSTSGGAGAVADEVANNTNTSSNATEDTAAVNNSHQSLLGANLEVAKALESIRFKDWSDGAMVNDVAYLQLWSKIPQRNTTVAVAGGQGATPYSAPSNNPLPQKVAPAATTTPTPDQNGRPVPEGVPTTTQPATSTPETGAGGIAGQSADQQKQKSLLSRIFGRIFSANPNGLHRGLLDQALGYASQDQIENQTKMLYERNKNGEAGTTSFAPTAPGTERGVWQFLFNPEEISVQGNSVYSTAETWGVMDSGSGSGKAQNSGQPMQWRYNQNEKLVFNKILLNGYVFGKRVDNLERALTDLISNARDDSPGGPPVLNFVWGTRTFGPCVIKDFNVREKNWDNGRLVNAEISLTLERVPEWVINDGFVDVARPARQGPISDPTAVSGATAPGQQPDTPAGGDSNTGGGAPSGNSPANNSSFAKCDAAVLYEGSFNYDDIYNYSLKSARSSKSSPGAAIDPRALYNMMFKLYEGMFSKASGSMGSSFTDYFKNGNNLSLTPANLWNTINTSSTNDLKKAKLRSAITTASAAATGVKNSETCKRAFADAAKRDLERKNKLLGGIKAGDCCTIGENQAYYNKTTGKTLICRKNTNPKKIKCKNPFAYEEAKPLNK